MQCSKLGYWHSFFNWSHIMFYICNTLFSVSKEKLTMDQVKAYIAQPVTF